MTLVRVWQAWQRILLSLASFVVLTILVPSPRCRTIRGFAEYAISVPGVDLFFDVARKVEALMHNPPNNFWVLSSKDSRTNSSISAGTANNSIDRRLRRWKMYLVFIS